MAEDRPAFTATRISNVVFKIVEFDDIYEENPFIYAKILPDLIVLVDTGCGGATNNPEINLTHLRQFLETYPVDDNDDKPLNPKGDKKYVVVCTHCHYDHILAIEQFAADSVIIASSHCPSFLSPANLGKNSLCEMLKIPTPKYEATLMDDLSHIIQDGTDTGLQVIHTPGHTPDELALWDKEQRMLYVGDTLYEWSPIIFPNAGDFSQWFSSVDKLISLVTDAERGGLEPVRINSGHSTSMEQALDVLNQARSFLHGVVQGEEPVKNRTSGPDGTSIVFYQRQDKRFSLRCPESLIKRARITAY